MTPQFTASAYVRCEKNQQIDEICSTLVSLGWRLQYRTLNTECEVYVVTNPTTGCFSVVAWVVRCAPRFNCGTDTSLFLELARMRSDVSLGQFYIKTQLFGYKDKSQEDPIDTLIKCVRKEFSDNEYFRRASTQEVYEYLKRDSYDEKE